jgi:hypothetical protein
LDGVGVVVLVDEPDNVGVVVDVEVGSENVGCPVEGREEERAEPESGRVEGARKLPTVSV